MEKYFSKELLADLKSMEDILVKMADLYELKSQTWKQICDKYGFQTTELESLYMMYSKQKHRGE